MKHLNDQQEEKRESYAGDNSKPPPRTGSFGVVNFFIIIHAAGDAKADIVFLIEKRKIVFKGDV
jgi:hypothetical protein